VDVQNAFMEIVQLTVDASRSSFLVERTLNRTVSMRKPIMKILAVVCNILFWLFFCVVMVTDGPPRGTDILFSILPFLMPILNVVVLRNLSSSGRTLKLVALVCNILWLGFACWTTLERLPSHPMEEGLIEYVVLMALTPIVSAGVIWWGMKSGAPVKD
jgi:hypothetical protein